MNTAVVFKNIKKVYGNNKVIESINNNYTKL